MGQRLGERVCGGVGGWGVLVGGVREGGGKGLGGGGERGCGQRLGE